VNDYCGSQKRFACMKDGPVTPAGIQPMAESVGGTCGAVAVDEGDPNGCH
jgi:hypothetical protein